MLARVSGIDVAQREVIAEGRRILLAVEKAETEGDPAERARLLNFVVVGGGLTGVEMAGAIAELANRALAANFPGYASRAL